jgi:hypothetical protein
MHVISCEIYVRHYMNGNETELLIQMIDGSTIRCRHGWDIDDYKIKDAIDQYASNAQPSRL